MIYLVGVVGFAAGFASGVVYTRKKIERALQDVLVKMLEIKEPDASN